MLRVGDTAEVHQECVTFGLSALADLPEAAFMITTGEAAASGLVGCLGPDVRRERLFGGNAYNSDQPWAFRLRWDRGAIELPFPEFSFQHAAAREEIKVDADDGIR